MSVDNSNNSGDSSDGPSPRQKAAGERAYQEHKPDDNPFIGIVEELHDQGKSFEEIHEIMEEAYHAVEEAWGEEMCFLVPEWEVTLLVDDPNTPSGTRYETRTRAAETAEEAERELEEITGWPVESDKTELKQYSKVA